MPKPIYAVGDIHGQLHELDRVLGLIEQDGGPDAEIVFVGDYVDRGADSAKVLDRLIAGRKAAKPWICLKGNHDRMFEWFMQTYPKHDAHLPIELSWLHPRLGGETTLASYGVSMNQKNRQLAVHALAREAVPEEHVAFIQGLSLCHQTDEVFFAHAGIAPGIPLDNQIEHDLLWIRKEFHNDPRMHPKLIVHGHTPVKHATHYGNRINIDAGAAYGNPLVAIVLEGRTCWELTAKGRMSLLPE